MMEENGMNALALGTFFLGGNFFFWDKGFFASWIIEKSFLRENLVKVPESRGISKR